MVLLPNSMTARHSALAGLSEPKFRNKRSEPNCKNKRSVNWDAVRGLKLGFCTIVVHKPYSMQYIHVMVIYFSSTATPQAEVISRLCERPAPLSCRRPPLPWAAAWPAHLRAGILRRMPTFHCEICLSSISCCSYIGNIGAECWLLLRPLP